jgi:hypothetical protein
MRTMSRHKNGTGRNARSVLCSRSPTTTTYELTQRPATRIRPTDRPLPIPDEQDDRVQEQDGEWGPFARMRSLFPTTTQAPSPPHPTPHVASTTHCSRDEPTTQQASEALRCMRNRMYTNKVYLRKRERKRRRRRRPVYVHTGKQEAGESPLMSPFLRLGNYAQLATYSSNADDEVQ